MTPTNKNCAFTIVAKNYIGLGLILEESIKKYNTNTDFYIIVADEMDKIQKGEAPSNVLEGREILGFDESKWYEMAFKYNLTEFCTSIKPKSISYFLDEGYERVMYLDPDTFFFNDIEKIFEMLDNHEVILSPHLIHLPSKESVDLPERVFLNCGTYNLGFIAVKDSPEVRSILNWWNSRLMEYAFNDAESGLFTDQLWMNLVPGFLGEKCLISRHQGLDVAPWNFSEREIILSGDSFTVKNRYGQSDTDPLIFTHFSGYDYISLTEGIIHQKTQPNLTDYPDVKPLIEEYVKSFGRNADIFKKYISNQYSYSKYSNGDQVTSLNRRMYHKWLETDSSVGNPFDSDGDFYRILKRNKFIACRDSANVDKIRRANLPDLESKEGKIITFARIIHRVLGIKKYTLLLKYARGFTREENQIKLIKK